MVKTPSFYCRGRGFDPWSGNQGTILTELIVSGNVTFLWRMTAVCQVGYLTGADQEIPDGLVKITFLGKNETAVRLGIVSVW